MRVGGAREAGLGAGVPEGAAVSVKTHNADDKHPNPNLASNRFDLLACQRWFSRLRGGRGGG